MRRRKYSFFKEKWQKKKKKGLILVDTAEISKSHHLTDLLLWPHQSKPGFLSSFHCFCAGFFYFTLVKSPTFPCWSGLGSTLVPVPVLAMELLKSQAGRFYCSSGIFIRNGTKNVLVLAFPPLAQALRLVPVADTQM